MSLLGPSGCGKSTLLLMIAGLLAGSAGEIRLDGRPVAGPQTDIGIMFQGNTLVTGATCWATCCCSSSCAACRARPISTGRSELLRSVGLERFAARHPYELSGGMQQRAAFCQALVHDPPLVLMDEPLGKLDAMTREQLRSDLRAALAARPARP